jgi:hypothetical protein
MPARSAMYSRWPFEIYASLNPATPARITAEVRAGYDNVLEIILQHTESPNYQSQFGDTPSPAMPGNVRRMRNELRGHFLT